MAEEKKDKFIVRSVRAPEEALDFLKELGDSEFANQGEALQYLVNLWNLESAKKSVGREKEIEDFQHLIGRIEELYVQSLSLCTDTEDRIRKEFADRLENQETTIRELREERDKMKAELDAARQTIKEKEAAVAKLDKEMDESAIVWDKTNQEHETLQETIKNNNKTIANLRETIDNLQKEMAEVEQVKRELETEKEKSKELEEKLKQEAKNAENQLTKAVLEERKARYDEYKALMDELKMLRAEK
ncbi:MAG: hypothetical protein K6A76_08205 [Oribacterium sp.]|nr:hypothetical protein [Oribacterium sp.]